MDKQDKTATRAKKPLLEIKKLAVDVEKGKNIIKDLDFTIENGEVYILFGPNGSGKSTLMLTVAGINKVKSGKILFEGKDITNLSVDKRAKMGIRTAFQLPPDIVGVKLRDILKICLGKSEKEELTKSELSMVERFRLTEFLDRDMNVNFSGGEKKRAEILQLILMKPKLMLIDEPDSGVDIQTLEFLGKEIDNYAKQNNASALIVTHHGTILNHIDARRACVLLDKEVFCYGNPKNVIRDIKLRGYEGCRRCRCPVKYGKGKCGR